MKPSSIQLEAPILCVQGCLDSMDILEGAEEKHGEFNT